MLEIGATVAGKYRVERIIGMGGMGVVAIATHVQLAQQFALKVMHDALSEDHATVERFIREARASARLKSEHVCRVSDVDQLDTGAPFIVMELLEGLDLQQLLRQAVLPIATAADYVLQACVAVAEAHNLGIVHRDLKPANLFLTNRMDGSPLIKVLDFGIAKATADAELQITQTQAIMGSPGYMSPEQLRSSRDVDARSDVWALGVILYELTTGRLPFVGQTITELAVKVAVDAPQPLPPDMDPGFAAIIARCLEKDVERRYPSVAALAMDLAPYAGAAGMHSASLIARLSGSQPQVSGPRSVVAPVTGTQLTSAPAPRTGPAALAPTALPAAKSRKRPLLIAGALVLIAGAAVGGYALTRKDEPKAAAKKPPHRDAGAVVVTTPPADAGKDAMHQMIEGLRANRQWLELIGLEKAGTSDDPEVVAAIADARTAYAAEVVAKIEAAVKASDCGHAMGLATGAKPYVDPAPLVAVASKCVPKKVVAPVGSGSGSGSGSAKPVRLTTAEISALVADGQDALRDREWAHALDLAKQILADGRPHPGAARIGGIAACQLGHGAEAQRYYEHIPPIGPKPLKMREDIRRACESKKIKLE